MKIIQLPVKLKVENKPVYTVKHVWKNKFGVINTSSGLLQSSWDTLKEANTVAYDLNRSL